MPPEYPEHVSKELCHLRHYQVEKDIREIKAEIQKINGKMWGVLIMIVAQLMGVITIFLKA